MTVSLDLEWWPPLEPMGEEHARELVQAVKPHAPAALAAARQWLVAHAPNAEPSVHSSTVAEISRLSLDPTMRGICIGAVWVPGSSGRPVVVGIAVTREGRLAITTPAEGAQDWTVVGE